MCMLSRVNENIIYSYIYMYKDWLLLSVAIAKITRRESSVELEIKFDIGGGRCSR